MLESKGEIKIFPPLISKFTLQMKARILLFNQVELLMAHLLFFICYLILTYNSGNVPEQRCGSARAHFPTAGFGDVTSAILAG